MYLVSLMTCVPNKVYTMAVVYRDERTVGCMVNGIAKSGTENYK